jgi:putative hydrolase of the HAD superfamily
VQKYQKIPSNIRALAFDMDDTLIAFDAVTHKSWQQVVKIFCDQGKFNNPAELLKIILETSSWYWSDETRHQEGRKNLLKARIEMVALAFQKIGLSKKEAIKIAKEYSILRDKNIFIYEGVYDILENAKRSGFKLALITNGQSSDQRKKIERFNLEPYFDHIMIEGELNYGKPEKKFYIELLQRLKEPLKIL